MGAFSVTTFTSASKNLKALCKQQSGKILLLLVTVPGGFTVVIVLCFLGLIKGN